MTTLEAPAGAPAALTNLPADDLAEILDWLRQNWKGDPAPERPTTVTEALCRVMAELPGIGKDQTSPQGYNYRGIEAITQHAQHLFARYGVIFGVPKITERKTIEITVNGKPWTEEQLTLVYTVYGPSHGKVRTRRVPIHERRGGETLVTGVVEIDEVVDDSLVVGPLLGLGRDNSDKGANKALTQAYKYALIQTLCIGDSKDDPDSQRAAETDAGPSEWWGGWATEDVMQEAIAHFRETLKEWVEAGRMTQEQATAAWSDYQRPDGPTKERKVRTRAQHEQIMADTFPAAESPQEPPAAETPPEPAAEAEPPAEPAQEPAQPEPAPLPAGYPDVPPDNGYRGRLDQVVREEGVDGMIEALKKLDVEAVAAELTQRGVDVTGAMKVSEVRQLLGAILLARHTAGPAAAPAAPPARPRKTSGRGPSSAV